MNKSELVDHIAQEADVSKAVATAALEAVLNGITTALKNEDEVRLVGFGTFTAKKREASTGRNPATGKEIAIPASITAKFKVGAALKAALNA
jgi:DNA-binding protein HU-beta